MGIKARAWGGVLVGAVAGILLWGHWWLFGSAVVATMGVLWSLGVISNHALAAEAQLQESRNSKYRSPDPAMEGLCQEMEAEGILDGLPNWPFILNIIFTVACVGLLIAGSFLRF